MSTTAQPWNCLSERKRKGPPQKQKPSVPRRRQERFGRPLAGIEFVRIPAAEFLMGSTTFSGEEPEAQVRISQEFWLGKYDVTQAEWETFVEANPPHFDGCGPNCPVENPSWNDAQLFIERLNFLSSEYGGGAEYRLSTVAEWGYAARAGTSGDRYYPDFDAIAWYDGNSAARTHALGRRELNAWGLHDMLGNVYEMVPA